MTYPSRESEGDETHPSPKGLRRLKKTHRRSFVRDAWMFYPFKSNGSKWFYPLILRQCAGISTCSVRVAWNYNYTGT